jgi:hypothetical protein
MPRRVLEKANLSARPVMTPKVVEISLFGGSLRAGACVMVYLAHPEDERSRREAACVLGYEAVRLAAAKNPDASEISVPREYLAFGDDAERKKILDEVYRRLSERLTAARVARLLFRQVILKHRGLVAAFPTIMSGVQKYLDTTAGAEVDNFQTRILRPSYPVLHLAVTLEVMLADVRHHFPAFEDLERQWLSEEGLVVGGPNLLAYDCLLDHKFVTTLLKGAQFAACLIAHTPALKRAAGQLIQFNVAETSKIRRISEDAADAGFRDPPGRQEAKTQAPLSATASLKDILARNRMHLSALRARTAHVKGAAGGFIQLKASEPSKIRRTSERDAGALFRDSRGHENAKTQAPPSATETRQDMAARGRARLSAFRSAFKKDS